MDKFFDFDKENSPKIRFIPMPSELKSLNTFFSIDHLIEPMDTDVRNPMEAIDAARKIAFKKYSDNSKEQKCIFDEYISKAKELGLNPPVKKVKYYVFKRIPPHLRVFTS